MMIFIQPMYSTYLKDFDIKARLIGLRLLTEEGEYLAIHVNRNKILSKVIIFNNRNKEVIMSSNNDKAITILRYWIGQFTDIHFINPDIHNRSIWIKKQFNEDIVKIASLLNSIIEEV